MAAIRTLGDVIELSRDFWMQLGKDVQGWVKDDCLKGLMQDGKQKLRYRSKQYVKYKANRMERFTTRKYKTGEIGRKGTKLKAYKSVPIESNKTQFVNMILTGGTTNRLHPQKADNISVTMAFSPLDTDKILRCQDYGYNIIGLNDKNRMLVKNEIIKKLDKNLKAWGRKEIKIYIGK